MHTGACGWGCYAARPAACGCHPPAPRSHKLHALLGHPPCSCGKTTLLDTLAGRLAHTAKLSGDIRVNGHKSKLSFGKAAYVTQVFEHSPSSMQCTAAAKMHSRADCLKSSSC